MNQALFFLSTGRCGTQWVAEVLADAYGERALVSHEPLGDDYAPRMMLAARDPARLDPESRDAVMAHVEEIERTLAERHYVECGHPLWSTLPYLLDRFAGRARVVHLARHPVPTALSWVTMNAYTAPFAQHLQERVLLSPFDEGTHFTDYRDRWDSLTPYEKCLYYWAEVNAFGLRLQERTATPWLLLRFEDLADGQVQRLFDFAGTTANANAVRGARDKFHYLASVWSDPGLIEQHPVVMDLARRIGYDPLAFDTVKLRKRYCGD